MSEKKVLHGDIKKVKGKLGSNPEQSTSRDEAPRGAPSKRGSAYKGQLLEKQRVKQVYGVREASFNRFFTMAASSRAGLTGANLLCFLERRLDNVLYRLKLSSSRKQARQAIVHGNVLVNDKKVNSPSFLVRVGDKVSFAERILQSEAYVRDCIDKRLAVGIKVPAWLELRKDSRMGVVSRMPVRSDVPAQFEEHLVVELYSKC